MKSILYGRSGKQVRRIGLILVDLCFAAVSVYLAMQLRFDGAIPRLQYGYVSRWLPAIIAIYGLSGILCGVYDMMWRFAGGPELFRLGAGYAAAATVTLVLNSVFNLHISRPVLVMTAIIMLILVVSSRFMWRWLRGLLARGGSKRQTRILIVGAGEGGAYAMRICQQNRANFGTPVAFVDDDPMKRRMKVGGVPVCGAVADIPEIVKQKNIDEIIVAIPGTHGERLTEIISLCKSTRCRTRILSDPNDVDRDGKATAFRELNTSDFLSRAEVALDMDMIRGYLADQVVMVTGGGGSIGSEICRQIMRFKPKKLLIFDIYENCAYELECELKQRYGADCPVEVLIGSIRDRRRLDDVFDTWQPKVVFHAAAHKHVPLMEISPGEAIKNNVLGTLNLLQAASEHGVERFVQLSTDKAVNPTNVVGATKRITEMMLQSFARHTEMKCMAVRVGNVLGSHGSVIPLFESQIRRGGPVTLTHQDITRYFMTIPEAAQLVLQAGGLANSGAIYLMDMGQPVKIIDLARKLIRFYGYEPGVDMEITVIGLRPGEKLHEELMMDKESKGVTRTAHDKIFVAPPIDFSESAFETQLYELRHAVEQDDDQLIINCLMDIVPTYHPNRDMLQ
ncbi:MAG: polysaccharide biosynthesis protein [Clostridia bacterium]|nr:polysaccharide biosynthesis protein [Clostridia bacterium]